MSSGPEWLGHADRMWTDSGEGDQYCNVLLPIDHAEFHDTL